MKLLLALIFGLTLQAHATILLTTPYSVTGPTGIASSYYVVNYTCTGA